MSEPVNYDPFAGGDVVRIVPITDPQQEIWTATRISDEASCAFNAPLLLQFRGKLICDSHDFHASVAVVLHNLGGVWRCRVNRDGDGN